MGRRLARNSDTFKDLERCRTSAHARDRRSSPRFAMQSLRCNLGRVLDLGRDGMRIESTRPLSGQHMVTIPTNEGRFEALADAAWSRRVGFRRYEVGLDFVTLGDEAAWLLLRIWTCCRARNDRPGSSRPAA